ALALARRIKPLLAHRVLRPFLEAYRVVGDGLERLPEGGSFDEGAFVTASIGLGKQYQLQRRMQSPESVSKVLFQSAIAVARNRGAIGASDGDVVAKRRALATELRDALRRVDAIDALAASRRAGLID